MVRYQAINHIQKSSERILKSSPLMILIIFALFVPSVLGLNSAEDNREAIVITKFSSINETREMVNFINNNGGETLFVFMPNVIVGYIPREEEQKIYSHAPDKIAGIFDSLLDISLFEEYNSSGALLYWNSRFASEALSMEDANEPPKILNDLLMPLDRQRGDSDDVNIYGVTEISSSAPDDNQTSEYMYGDVFVSVILLESNGIYDDSTEDWTSSEESNVDSEIANGLRWWLLKKPINVKLTLWIPSHYKIQTKYEPINRPGVNDTLGQGLWIKEAMDYLGVPSVYPDIESDYWYRVRKYNDISRDANNFDWAFTIFIVDSSNDPDGKFTDKRFGYAYFNGPFIVMTYTNDGYGISNMDAVTAHETGHIFGAADQYSGPDECDSNSDCYSTFGFLLVQHQNCQQNCLSNVESIMRGQTEPFTHDALDYYARGQIGWRDMDEDDIDDVIDATYNNGGDEDMDGIVDYWDSCPTIAGHSYNDGCPLIEISGIECRKNGTFSNCSGLSYGDFISGVRFICSVTPPSLLNITEAKFRLVNLDDSKILFSGSTGERGSGLFEFDINDTGIKDSGDFTLESGCIDKENQEKSLNVSWSIPFGSLEPSIPYTGNITVSRHKFFDFRSEARCIGGECGNISALLDPLNPAHRTCSEAWGFDCGAGPPEAGNNTFDRCKNSRGGYESVEEIFLNATSIQFGETLKATCTFKPFISLDYYYIWYYNGTGWRNLLFEGPTGSLWNVDRTVEFTPDNFIGTHWIRCSVGYFTPDNDGCFNSSRNFDNDDVNFTMGEFGKGAVPVGNGTPFYTISQNPSMCNNLLSGDVCSIRWIINATGAINSSWNFFASYNPMNYLRIAEAKTAKVSVKIFQENRDVNLSSTRPFFIKDSKSEIVAYIDDNGNLILKGILEQNSNYQRKPSDLFVIRNNKQDVFVVDSSGNVYIDGTLTENQDQGFMAQNYPQDFAIKDNSGNKIAVITESGSLVLKGSVNENVLCCTINPSS